MEQRLLLSSQNPIFPFPSFLPLQKTQFFGKTLTFPQRPPPPPLLRHGGIRLRPVTAAAVKRRKEVPFDNVIQRDKKLKLVLKIRNILVSQPDRVMNLRDLGRYRRDLGLTRKRRFIALLKRFPAVFEIVEEGVYSLRFRLTPEAERVYFEELRARNEMEQALVAKLRKLLMMSLEKRILLEKIAHLKADLGLPTDFRDTICERYPQYFRVVRTDRGPALELTHWDPELAVSAAEVAEEENRAREAEERNLIIDRPPKFRRVKLPRGLNLSKGEMRRINMFKEMPYISPYSDFSELRSGSAEKEKHACAVIHEMLSLTLEKRTLVDHLTHFREEFRFSQQLRGMLIRHPDMFYVSLKGDRDSVFLREAYRDSQLLEKDKLLVLKEKLRALVAVPRFPMGDSGRGWISPWWPAPWWAPPWWAAPWPPAPSSAAAGLLPLPPPASQRYSPGGASLCPRCCRPLPPLRRRPRPRRRRRRSRRGPPAPPPSPPWTPLRSPPSPAHRRGRARLSRACPPRRPTLPPRCAAPLVFDLPLRSVARRPIGSSPLELTDPRWSWRSPLLPCHVPGSFPCSGSPDVVGGHPLSSSPRAPLLGPCGRSAGGGRDAGGAAVPAP